MEALFFAIRADLGDSFVRRRFFLAVTSEFWPSLLVRVVTSSTRLSLVATNASLLIFIAEITAVSCAISTFSVVTDAAMLSKYSSSSSLLTRSSI